MAVMKWLAFFGPLFFAFGFLTPLVAQAIERVGWTPPFGLTPLAAGFILAGTYGLIAQVRGRWL